MLRVTEHINNITVYSHGFLRVRRVLLELCSRATPASADGLNHSNKFKWDYQLTYNTDLLICPATHGCTVALNNFAAGSREKTEICCPLFVFPEVR